MYNCIIKVERGNGEVVINALLTAGEEAKGKLHELKEAFVDLCSYCDEEAETAFRCVMEISGDESEVSLPNTIAKLPKEAEGTLNELLDDFVDISLHSENCKFFVNNL